MMNLNQIKAMVNNRYLRRASVGGVMGAASLYSYGRFVETANFAVERVTIGVPGLSAENEGFTIALISDFHAGSTPQHIFHKAIQIVNSLKPDLILMAGDFVDHYPETIFDLAPILSKLEAPYGKYGIFGNHDMWTVLPENKTMIRYGLDYYGIPLLVNENVRLDNGIIIAGLDDVGRGDPDLHRALSGTTVDDTVILMVHRPDPVDDFSLDPRIDIQLSGHSHGGQIKFPIIGAPILPALGKKYVEGLYQVRDVKLYVTRGIGVAHKVKLRWNCPPEISLLTLTQHQGTAATNLN